MKSSGGFALPAAPPGTGPSSRTRKDSRPAHFHQQAFGVESYVPAQSRERILALQAHQAQVQAQHERQWTHTSANQPQGHPTHAPSTAWRGTPTPPPATPPPATYTGSSFSSHAAEYARAGGYADPTLPPPLLQPRPPPPQQSASQLQKNRPPPPPSTTARFSAARPRTSSAASADAPAQQSARMHRARDDSNSPEPSSPTKRFGSTQPLTPSAQQHAVTSLKEKVALALADLESIKNKSYRPSTAAAGSSTSRDASLPRPNLTSGGPPHPSISAAAAERAAEELRTAKSILRKLYKKNVQLSADIKQLRTRTSASSSAPAAAASLSPRSSDGASMFDEAETKLLADSAASASSPHKRDEDEEEEDPREEEDGGEEDGFDSPKRSRPRSQKAAKVGKNGIGGPSHLLFLLGERDTTINKLQAQVQSLHRKVNGMAGRLELGGSSATAAAESAGSEAMFSDASGVDRYQSQLQVLRRSFGDKLRSQMVQLQHMGEPSPSPRVSAYIADLERWLIWEASWRQVEKTALNAQCRQAEKQAQESWVRSRLLEREVQEVQQRFHALDSKTRLIDTQLASALERNKHLELENLRLKK